LNIGFESEIKGHEIELQIQLSSNKINYGRDREVKQIDILGLEVLK
jgi:hypothetical protein